MALGWLAAFKAIPWTKVVSAAPTIVEGGHRLWTLVRQRPGAEDTPHARPAAGSVPESIAALEVRLGTLESQVSQLKEEAVSSYEVVRALTEQHSQLVGAVDILIARTRVLLRACIVLGVALVALAAALFLLR
jgi:hypothetical protein